MDHTEDNQKLFSIRDLHVKPHTILLHEQMAFIIYIFHN